MRVVFLLPLLIFLVLICIFSVQLISVGQGKRSDYLPSVLIDHPVPEFALPALPNRGRPLSSADLKGQITLVNIFGSWCTACLAEHQFLMRIKNANLVHIHGINWHDDAKMAAAWLYHYGDPYDLVGLDMDSQVVIDFGVTGAPETFVVDARGIIRYRHVGPLTYEVWEGILYPLLRKLWQTAS